MLVQFDLSPGDPATGNSATLSALMTQRSADMGLGVPFNIASYALLTHLLAHVVSTAECPVSPGTLTFSLGNAHVYSTHIEQLKRQLVREPKPAPTLNILAGTVQIDQFKPEDLLIENYEYHPRIAMDMVV